MYVNIYFFEIIETSFIISNIPTELYSKLPEGLHPELVSI